MKNHSFIKKYSKWIVRVLVIIWIGLIYRLWAVWLYISDSCSWWYISLCLGWDIEYYWISASTIALIFFMASIFLIKKIKKTKNEKLRLQLAFIIFVLWIIWTPLFYIVSPDFKFYLQKAEYKDSRWNITDIDKYLELTNKYCRNDIEWDNFDFKYSRETMCSWKFETNFKTVEEYIKILDYANKNNFKFLYDLVYRRIDKNVGLENMIEKYDDDTFYAKTIKYIRTDTNLMNKLINITSNDNIENLSNIIINWLSNFYKWIEENSDNKSDKWNIFRDEMELLIKQKIKQIPEVNQKIF